MFIASLIHRIIERLILENSSISWFPWDLSLNYIAIKFNNCKSHHNFLRHKLKHSPKQQQYILWEKVESKSVLLISCFQQPYHVDLKQDIFFMHLSWSSLSCQSSVGYHFFVGSIKWNSSLAWWLLLELPNYNGVVTNYFLCFLGNRFLGQISTPEPQVEIVIPLALLTISLWIHVFFFSSMAHRVAASITVGFCSKILIQLLPSHKRFLKWLSVHDMGAW